MKEKNILNKIITRKDPEMFGQLYDGYVSKIYRFVYFKVQSTQEAEDITSEVFLKSWQYLTDSKSKQIDNVGAFLYKLARNGIADYYRRKHADVCLDDVAEYIKDQKEEIEEKVHLDFEAQKLYQAMDALKPDYKEVIVLKYIEQLSSKEISVIIDKNQGATRVLLHRAIKALKKIIKKK